MGRTTGRFQIHRRPPPTSRRRHLPYGLPVDDVVSPVPFHDELLGDEFADPSRVEREVVELERLVGVEDGLDGGLEDRSLV
jgi:hypothetical protein